MKPIFTSILALTILTASGHHTEASEATKLQPQKPTVEESEFLYEIKNKEIIVNDQLITLFAFSEKGVSASYRNKTQKTARPSYTFKAYNNYGMLVASREIGKATFGFGSNTTMEPGAVSSEKIRLKAFPLNEILKNANFELPTDLNTMKWVIIADTNSKLGAD